MQIGLPLFQQFHMIRKIYCFEPVLKLKYCYVHFFWFWRNGWVVQSVSWIKTCVATRGMSILDTIHNFANKKAHHKKVDCYKSDQKSPKNKTNFLYTLYVLKLDVDCSMGAGIENIFDISSFNISFNISYFLRLKYIVKGLFKSVLKAFKRRPKIEANQRTTTTTSSI